MLPGSTSPDQRAHFLREAKSITVFQPDRMEELIGIAMDELAEPGREWAFTRERTQDDVLVELPALLGNTDFCRSRPYLRDAFKRLWTLTRNKSNEIHNRARKELKKAIGYHKYKNPGVCNREKMLDVASKKLLPRMRRLMARGFCRSL